MLGELSGVFELVGQFAEDMFQADIDRAKVEVESAKAELARLEARKRATDKLMARYRASVAKVKADQDKWQREANKRLKRMPKIPPFPIGGVTEAFVPSPVVCARSAG
jgi:hypothetical protein